MRHSCKLRFIKSNILKKKKKVVAHSKTTTKCETMYPSNNYMILIANVLD